MSHEPAVFGARAQGAAVPLVVLAVLALSCSSSGKSDACFPDADGVSDRSYEVVLTVDDDGFSKTILNTQNSSTVTLTLTNAGTLPHGFELECVSVTAEYPNLPAGCPSVTCFPDGSTIEPIPPGTSQTVTFVTPVTDNLIYPFKSGAPGDATVPALNDGQWSLM